MGPVEATSAFPVTVVMESALSGASLDWAYVQPKVAENVRTCIYDRAGYGWSQPAPSFSPRCSRDLAVELHTLLDAAGIPAPYLLVGHSMGGYHVRAFAGLYPSETAGMVLVDASHEDLFSFWPETLLKRDARQLRIARLLAVTGILRLMIKAGWVGEVEAFAGKFPVYMRPTVKRFYSRPSLYRTALRELACRDLDASQVRQLCPPGSLGSRPLAVVAAGAHRLPGTSGSGREGEWRQRQVDLASLSSNSRLFLAEASDHYVQLDQPERVVEAILWVIEQILPEQGRLA